jgi:hypothetical protein|tara:strand:+ start:56 stop:319 length:264 start_codon:yes stop_codon:yes gene_type:complete
MAVFSAYTKVNRMKPFKLTRDLVDQLLVGNPLGNVFLISALQQHADSVIKHSAYLKKNDIDSKELINPHALARTAEEVVKYMDKHFK